MQFRLRNHQSLFFFFRSREPSLGVLDRSFYERDAVLSGKWVETKFPQTIVNRNIRVNFLYCCWVNIRLPR